MSKNFYEKPLFTFPNYIFSFIQSSFYFFLCNILLIFFFIVTYYSPKTFSTILLYLCLIPMGPSLGALYCVCSKLISEKDIFFASKFWYYYKYNFKSYIKIWFIELTLLLIFTIDYEFFYFNLPNKIIQFIFILLNITTLAIGFYTFAINSKFAFKLKDLFLLSILYSVKKFPVTIMKLIILIFCFFLVGNIGLIFIPFIPAALCTIFYYFDRLFFDEIKNRFTTKSNNFHISD